MQDLYDSLGIKVNELYKSILDRTELSPYKRECFKCYLAIQIYYECWTIEAACEQCPEIGDDYKQYLINHFEEFKEYTLQELSELAILTLHAATKGVLDG